MTDRVRCDSCKQMVLTEWPHSCYDFDAVERVRQCERAVVEAAKEYVRTNDILCGETDAKCDTEWLAYMEEVSNANIAALDALFAAVRALDAAEAP